MGALHAGHMDLVRRAAERSDFVVVSIFVNPTQFGPNEDFARYPRRLEEDAALCAKHGAHAVFAPEVASMYPPGDETRVRVGATAGPFCGEFRPGHFEGVATVVTKLLVLTGPAVAFFGRKDYQQLQVIRRFATDLFLPTEIVGAATVREPDGVAMSSRNAYLSPEERLAARAIPEGLAAAWRAFAAGERRAGALTGLVRASVEKVARSIDYVDIADPDSLVVKRGDEPVGERAVLALAIRLGPARLIDNVVLGEDGPPGAEGSN
jgi:pantoate--beta-alanine ligase